MSSDDEFTPKYKKSYGVNIKANFNAFMDRRREELIVADNVLFKNRKTFPKFVLAPLRAFLNLKLDRLSLLHIECEMDSTGYPDLMMNSHPNIRNVLEKIKRPSSMNLWSGNVMIF